MTPLSVLDLAPVREGGDVSEALANALDLARHCEALGFRRYWLAEHHNMRGIASAATSVVIGHVAGGTSTIRVGSGGVMLPNHAPLTIAEQFGTLAALYPGRIDLGLGRAPGTDPATAHALRRSLAANVDRFPQDVVELINYFKPSTPDQRVSAVPGEGEEVPVWMLGSSLYGAQLAAALGLPYAFASHFAPTDLYNALRLYREQFRPSEQLDKPYVMVACHVVAADTDEEAHYLASSLRQAFLNLRQGMPGRLPPPVQTMELTEAERAMLDQTLVYSAIGSRERVATFFGEFAEQTGADEIIVTSQIHDHGARRRSFEIAAEAGELSGPTPVEPPI